MSIRITVEFDDAKIKRLLRSDAFVRSLNYRLSHQFRGFGSYASGLVRRELNSGSGYAPLRVQQHIKGNTKVFIDTGRLMDSITYKFYRERHVSGLYITVADKIYPSGQSVAKIASVISRGAVFVPKESQRSILQDKIEMAGGPRPDPDISKRPVWIIPPRPFMDRALMKEAVVTKFAEKCVIALENALTEYLK